jgi:predicted metal-dependent HD superfamily phosphohydrolase
MNLLSDIENHATGILNDSDSLGLLYHNLSHTREIVNAVADIGGHSGLRDEELENVIIAAWFHDLGYTVNYADHETESIRMAREFLDSKGFDESRIDSVAECITATKIPQSPKNKLEEVICDADMYHLALENQFEQSLLLRKEQNAFRVKKTGISRFMKESLQFLLRPYYTEYARRQFAEGREKNISLTLKKIEEHKHRKKDNKKELKSKKEERIEAQQLRKKRDGGKTASTNKDFPTRGVETMFRVTANKQTNLNSMADNKSHNLITLNTLIISIIATLIISKYKDFPYLIIPAVLFLISSFLTLLFAILATRPRIYHEKTTDEDIKNKKVNLLFFGSYFRMSLDDYLKSMRATMQDYDQVYNMMIMDQYFTGVVLAKKYKLIRIAFLIFIIGFLVALITFGYAMFRYS